MKRYIAFLLLTMMVLTLFACKKNPPAEFSDNSGVGRYSDDGENELHYPVKYVYTYRLNIGGDYPEIITISSRADLLQYISDNANVYNFEKSWYSVSFYDAVTEYTEEFFESKSLLMAVIYEPSESYTHTLKQISKTDRGYSIDMIRFIPSETTDVEALWHIIVEVPKSSAIFAEGNEISLSMTEKAK